MPARGDPAFACCALINPLIRRGDRDSTQSNTLRREPPGIASVGQGAPRAEGRPRTRGGPTMARLERTQHAPQFLDSGDFNDQLYQALKKSPWWMISIAVHGLLYAVSTLVAPDEQQFAKS